MAKRTNLGWKELKPGTVVDEPGSAKEYETGDWKSQHPVLDKAKCSKCALCYIYCPEGCIKRDEEGYFISDLNFCKGCGICAVECPRKAIVMVLEGE